VTSRRRAARAGLGIAAALASLVVPPLYARQQAVFRATARAVAVDVAVRDGNRPVLDLTAQDFVVYDNDVPQTVDVVSLDTVPVDVTVFLGTSDLAAVRRLTDLGDDMRRILALLRPNDRIRLLTLENQVADAFGWRHAGDPDTTMNVRVGGVQSLYDALFTAMMHRPGPDRRHLIVAVTDGVEFGSVLDSKTVLDVADRAEGVLHLVFATEDAPPPPAARDVAAADPRLSFAPTRTSTLNNIADGSFDFLRATWFHVLPDLGGISRIQQAALATGGTVRTVRPGHSVVDTFARAFEDFRQSYVLLYTPAGVAAEGWHALRVEVRGAKYSVRARRGYLGDVGR
jgi:VWFA-related protein